MRWKVDLLKVVSRFTLNSNKKLYKFLKILLLLYLGDDYQSSQQLLETLWEYEEWKVTKEIETDANFVGKAQEIRRQKLNTHMTSNLSQTLNSQNSVITSVDQQEQLCVVCMSSPRSLALMPCGHIAVCSCCYDRLKQCPICRSVIRGLIRCIID